MMPAAKSLFLYNVPRSTQFLHANLLRFPGLEPRGYQFHETPTCDNQPVAANQENQHFSYSRVFLWKVRDCARFLPQEFYIFGELRFELGMKSSRTETHN